LYSSNLSGQAFCRLYIRQGNINKKNEEAASFNLGIAVRAYNITPIQWTDQDLLPNSIYLITMAYQIVPGINNDVAKLWIDQPFSETETSPKCIKHYDNRSRNRSCNLRVLLYDKDIIPP
jgi:hypothetical protein